MKTKCGCMEKAIEEKSFEILSSRKMIIEDYDTVSIIFDEDNFELEIPVSFRAGGIFVRIKVVHCPICGNKL